MRRFKRSFTILLFLLLALLTLGAAAPAHNIAIAAPAIRIDRVVLVHPGYTIAVITDGHVRVDFTLNEIGVTRQEIEGRYVLYPRERLREVRVDRGRSDVLFALVRSPQFAAVGPEYLASPGTFAYAGHRVVMTLTLYTGSTQARRVAFDTSRTEDWPAPLHRAFDEIIGLGRTAGPLPVGPLIE